MGLLAGHSDAILLKQGRIQTMRHSDAILGKQRRIQTVHDATYPKHNRPLQGTADFSV